MTLTLTRRIEQMEQSFGPTEAAARWLVEAKGYGSMAAYQAAFTTGEVPIPLVELPRLVTAWVKRNAQGETERSITQKTARAVRAVMTRVCLVDWMNSQIDWEKHVDEFALESFRDLAPCVLAARADVERRARWLARLTTCFTDTRTWEVAGQEVAERYFAGQSPFFPDTEDHLATVTRDCEALLVEYNAALVRKRRPILGEPVDVAVFRTRAAEQADGLISQLVERARVQVFGITGNGPADYWVQLLTTESHG